MCTLALLLAKTAARQKRMVRWCRVLVFFGPSQNSYFSDFPLRIRSISGHESLHTPLKKPVVVDKSERFVARSQCDNDRIRVSTGNFH